MSNPDADLIVALADHLAKLTREFSALTIAARAAVDWYYGPKTDADIVAPSAAMAALRDRLG